MAISEDAGGEMKRAGLNPAGGVVGVISLIFACHLGGAWLM